MKKSWKTRDRGLLLLAILSSSISLGWRFIVVPLQADMGEIDNEMILQEKQLKHYQRILKQADAYETHFEALSSRYNQAESETEIMARLVSEIQGVAESMPFRITNLRPQNISKEDKMQRYSIDIVLDADVVDVWHFIYILQRNPYAFSVTNARFDKIHHNKKENLKVRLTFSKTFVSKLKNDKQKR
ncbi:MAG: hypothetical protein K8S27_13435 [Candidatus Omnitrophica bacterium]|nr:hypothetical protein [Candidatus Omnitrophota bacterium]